MRAAVVPGFGQLLREHGGAYVAIGLAVDERSFATTTMRGVLFMPSLEPLADPAS